MPHTNCRRYGSNDDCRARRCKESSQNAIEYTPEHTTPVPMTNDRSTTPSTRTGHGGRRRRCKVKHVLPCLLTMALVDERVLYEWIVFIVTKKPIALHNYKQLYS